MLILMLGHKPLSIQTKLCKVTYDGLVMTDETQAFWSNLCMLLYGLTNLFLVSCLCAEILFLLLDAFNEICVIAQSHVMVLTCSILSCYLVFL